MKAGGLNHNIQAQKCSCQQSKLADRVGAYPGGDETDAVT